MYFCDNCGTLFETPKQATEHHGLKSPPYETLSVCPGCGQADYSVAQKCLLCHKYVEQSSLEGDCCPTCAGHLLRRFKEVLELYFSPEELYVLNELLDSKPVYE
jgi:hypothetical protein